MKISRLDLDGAGSPSALVTRILQVEKDLPIPVPIEALCERLDILSIGDLETEGFEAALITDITKSSGAILIAKDRSRQRRRFSIGHELGHFLIPAHMPPAGQPFLCSDAQMKLLNIKDENRRQRMEAEANRFAALLLIPPPALRAQLLQIRRPEVSDIIRLARLFDVSKDAIARAYIDYTREPVAVIVIRNGRVLRSYRNQRTFPWIAVGSGSLVPEQSIYHQRRQQGAQSLTATCDPGLWIAEAEARKVGALTEDVLQQQGGFALLLLHAELADKDDDDQDDRHATWCPLF